MTEEYYEVLYNPDYGCGLRFPEEFVNRVFELYPPDSEVGKELWSKTIDCILQEDEEVPEGRKHYYRIAETKEFCNGYVWLKMKSNNGEKEKPFSRYCTKDFKTYYYVTYNKYSWRDKKEIIALVKEMELDIPTDKVPKDYGYYIDEYDGMERVVIDCPNARIIKDLLDIISLNTISKKDINIHPLTLKLLDGETIHNVMNPNRKKLNLK